MKKIIITGGGTGGHVVPCLAIAENLKNDYEIHYIGSINGIEKEMVKNIPYIKYHEITTCKLIRSFTPKNLAIPFKLLKGYNQSKKLIKQIQPNIIFSKGGYVSVPVVYAGAKFKIPIISHESDLTLGLANKINLKKSKYMCCSFSKTAQDLKNKGVYTGSPIRKQIFLGKKENIENIYKLQNKQSILILGGSLGSKNLNTLIRNNLKTLCEKYNVFHICGKGNKVQSSYENYFQMEFVNNIQDYYKLVDVVISRAGSNVIFELLALNKKMILIPLEKNSRGDQVENAKYFEQKGYAKMLFENVTDNVFIKSITDMLDNNKIAINQEKEKTDAVNDIISLLKSNSL